MINLKTAVAIMIASSLLIARGVLADTEFTYQGELKDNGVLANGPFNMDFLLWDAVAGGNQIGSPIPLSGVQVVNGKFTVELDFGADSFDNSGRWLEIVVQGSTLSPRVPITRSPYSIQTRGIFVDGNENVGIGTTAPEDSLHIKKQTTTPNLPERMLIVDSHDDPNNFDLQLGSGSGILFKVPYQFDSQVGAAIDAVRATNVELNSATELVFSVSQNDETLTEAMRIDETGNVTVGGDLKAGPHGIGVPHAYGSVDNTGQIISGSSNVLSSSTGFFNEYYIEIEGDLFQTDIVLVTCQSRLIATASISSNGFNDLTVELLGPEPPGNPGVSAFWFVVYRP